MLALRGILASRTLSLRSRRYCHSGYSLTPWIVRDLVGRQCKPPGRGVSYGRKGCRRGGVGWLVNCRSAPTSDKPLLEIRWMASVALELYTFRCRVKVEVTKTPGLLPVPRPFNGEIVAYEGVRLDRDRTSHRHYESPKVNQRHSRLRKCHSAALGLEDRVLEVAYVLAVKQSVRVRYPCNTLLLCSSSRVRRNISLVIFFIHIQSSPVQSTSMAFGDLK